MTRRGGGRGLDFGGGVGESVHGVGPLFVPVGVSAARPRAEGRQQRDEKKARSPHASSAPPWEHHGRRKITLPGTRSPL